MVKPKLIYLVNVLLALSFIGTVITVPLRSRLHSPIGWIFVVLVVIHIIINWNWVVSMTKTVFKKSKK